MIKHKSKFILPFCIISIVIVLLTLFLATTRNRKTKTYELIALETSASAIQIQTGRDVFHQGQDRVTYDKGYPHSPEITIDYEPVSDYTKQDVYEELITVLEKNGWQKEKLTVPRPGYYRASLPQNGYALTVDIMIEKERNIVRVEFGTNPS